MSVAAMGAHDEPFGLTANPDGYVPTAAIEEAMEEAMTALDEGRVPVIAGPTGLGKTLVLQLLARARAERSRPLYIPFCTLGPEDLASLAIGLLERTAEPDAERQLLEEARRLTQGGQSLLLLVDDAAALPGETAAQLAHWLNASDGALQIALAGLPGPALRHARDAFGDDAEEILLVRGLRPEELPAYVEARLRKAAVDPQVRAAFDASALAQLERISEGNPRRVNLAAQAIVRNADADSEAERPPRESEGARVPSTASDLLNVGEYRFVRGRFVDPESGEPIAEAGPRVDETAPLPPRPPGPPPMYEPGPEPDAFEPEPEPGHGEPRGGVQPPGAFEIFNRDLPPEDAVHPPRKGRGFPIPVPVPYLVGAVLVVFLAAGLVWQLGRDEAPELAVEPPAPRAAPIAPVKPVAPSEPELEAPESLAAVEPEPAGEWVVPEIEPEVEVEPGVEVEVEPEVTPGAPTAEPEIEPDTLAVTEPEASPQAEPEPEPAPEIDAAEPTPDATAALEPAAEPEPEPIAPPPSETIAVAINATPWATIEVDGEEIGETPLAGIELTTGRHRFKARMPDGSVRDRVIRIDADTTTVVFE